MKFFVVVFVFELFVFFEEFEGFDCFVIGLGKL